jgi:ornithine cyclodeaminase
MPGILRGESVIVGTKIINANTGNPHRGIPRADGLTLLFDPMSAHPDAIVQAAQISALRTAAVSTAAAQRLRRPNADMLAIIGAGPIARAHAILMMKYLSLRCVMLSDLVPQRAEELAKEIRSQSGNINSVVTDPETAVRKADIIITATTVTEPYLPYAWLKSGSVIVNVSLDDVAADAYLQADHLYVDDWRLITHDSQRLLGRLARDGVISGPGELAPAGGRAVTGTLAQLVSDPGLTSREPDDIVLVNPFGMAITDLALAHQIVRAARARQLGIRLPR